MSERKQKTFSYKHAAFFLDGRRSLERSIRNAIAQLPLAMGRIEKINEDGTSRRLVNTVRSLRNTLCATVFMYEKEYHPPVVSLDDKATELPVSQMIPVGQPQKMAEFIEGLLFFCVQGNHVILVGSASLHSEQLERHLNWLLREATNAIPKDEMVRLCDPQKPDLRQRQVDELKSIVLHGNLGVLVTQRTPAPGVALVQQHAGRPQPIVAAANVSSLSGGIWETVRAFMRELGAEPPDVRFDGTVEPEDLEVKLEVKYTGSKNRTKEPTPFLDPLANAFRHIAEPPVDFIFRDGRKISGREMKISKVKSLPCTNGLPDTGQTFDSMVTYLEEVLRGGDITADGT